MGRRVFSGRFVLPAGALLCLFALYVALYPGTLYAQAADLHKQAQKLASQKKTAEADAMYLKALDAAPEDGSINADYGQFLLWQKKDPASALVRFDRALAVKYERTWIHRQRGQALASLHQYEQAEAALKEALKSAEKEMAKSKGQAAGEKNFVQASGILAQLYVDRDRYRDAVDLLNALLKRLPGTRDSAVARAGFEACSALGHIEFGNNNYDRALQYFVQADRFADTSEKTDKRAEDLALDMEKTLVARRKAQGRLNPVSTYRLLVVFIPKIDVDFVSLNGERITGRRELRPEQVERTRWIARSFARHWEAMTDGKIQVDVDFVTADGAVLRDFNLRYSTSERLAKTEVREPAVEKFPEAIRRIVKERYAETDSFVFIWNGEGIGTTANGGGRNYPVGPDQEIRRGFVHISADRLRTPGGPVLFLHEMQHNVESMTGESLAVDGNLATRTKKFPMCDGTAELRYFECLFGKVVPGKLADPKRFKKVQGMENLNFKARNPDPHPVKARQRTVPVTEEIGSGSGGS